MKRLVVVAMMMGCVFAAGEARAQKPPLLPEQDVAALANELSGETAKRNLEGIARFHRQRASRGFHGKKAWAQSGPPASTMRAPRSAMRLRLTGLGLAGRKMVARRPRVLAA